MDRLIRLDLERPVTYRWSGRFAAKDASWCHMERQLVDYELIVMEKGTLYIEDEAGKYEVSEGQYLLMEPTKMQRGWERSKCKFYWMHFLTDDPQKRQQEGTSGKETAITIPKQASLKNPERLYVLLKQLQDSDLRYMDPVCNGYFATTILYELANQVRSFPGAREDDDSNAMGEGAQARESADQGESLRERVEDYLYLHLSEPLSVGSIAREFGYHEKYFSALFKKKTGQSVKQYVDERKMDRAKYLLLNTDAWVVEIADHLGYPDVQNFYHVFKKMMNCTPSEYRRLYQKKRDSHV